MDITKDYIVVDLETTGLNPKQNRIIEVGAVKVRSGEVVETYQTLINPGWKIEPSIQELTGINQEQVDAAPYIKEKIAEICSFLGEDPLVGHNILFDYSFLKRAYILNSNTLLENENALIDRKNRLEFEKYGVDTLRIARKHLSDLPSRALVALCEHYHIEMTAHRALGDALATHQLYQKLIEEFGEECAHLEKLIYQVKKESPITRQQKERLLRIHDMHHILPDYEIEQLTRNEASRLIDIYIAIYGRNQC